MDILVLGGTRFLGRHLVEQALAAGHRLTLVHRGRSSTLFPQARQIVADRNGDLSAALGDGRWDAAIDTCAYVPRHVRSAAAVLHDRVGHYQLVSSISVYADPIVPGCDESAPMRTLPDPATEVVDGDTYGGLKALCEHEARAAFGDRACIVRPALIVGPHDPTGRFTWWVERLQRGGEVLAPGDPATPVQFIDVRDLAAWMLRQAEHGEGGTCNLTGPGEPIGIVDLLHAARDELNPAARLTWVDERFVLDHGVSAWTDLPVWLPRAEAAMHQLSLTAARARGLSHRPLADTLRDTAAWLQQAGGPAHGLAPEREAQVLAAWHARGA